MTSSVSPDALHKFIEPVLAGNVVALMSEMAPVLRNDVDEPSLAQYLFQIKEPLGNFTNINPDKVEKSVEIHETQGTIYRK
jgi:hypothetical protein